MVLREEEAVRHIFRVAGGLESQILGESQILAQVKRALALAQEAGTAGRVLFRLSERALRVGKRIRTETALGEGALSASYAALELARKIFGSLNRKRVLIIGAGEIAVLTLQNLQGIPLGSLTILNRSREHAVELADRFGGKVRDFSELSDALGEADIVISSTSSKEPIVSFQEMKKIRHQRGGNQPLLVVDLALPRDFDERCGTLDEVFLKNLDDLREIVSGNIAEREKELPRAEAIVEKELGTFLRWLEALEVEPTIRRLRELFHGMREDELREWKGSVDPATYARVEEMTRRLVNRLLHVPITNLRRHTALREQGLSALIHEILTEEIPYSEGSPDGNPDGDGGDPPTAPPA
jgi:glutamyl-tRNA reductase